MSVTIYHCENCNIEHDGTYGSGRFCSTQCSNSRLLTYTGTKPSTCIKCKKTISISKYTSHKIAKCIICKKECDRLRAKKYEKSYSRNYKPKTCPMCEVTKISYRASSCRPCKSAALIQRWKDGLENGVTGNSTKKFIKRYLIETRGEKCERCGWNEHSQYTGNIPIELEHIDGNFRNNDESNLELLYPNCHSLTPTYRILNMGNGRPR